MAVGGEFYPLVVETYGFWTPARLQTLKLIFSRVHVHCNKFLISTNTEEPDATTLNKTVDV